MKTKSICLWALCVAFAFAITGAAAIGAALGLKRAWSWYVTELATNQFFAACREGRYEDAAKLMASVDVERPSVQAAIGRMFEMGNGVDRNDAEAVRWYRMATEKGNARALNNLGTMYYDGRGVEKNPAVAVEFFMRASERGNILAPRNIGNAYYYGVGVESNHVEAAKWYRMAAEKGEAVAQYDLGLMYLHGRGVEKDIDEAMEWFHLSARNGYGDAIGRIGWMYLNGTGVTTWRRFAGYVRRQKKASFGLRQS